LGPTREKNFLDHPKMYLTIAFEESHIMYMLVILTSNSIKFRGGEGRVGE